MANTYFRFKQFIVYQDRCAMKVTTDACLFGAWAARAIGMSTGNILDIGTGTGLLSLMLAQQTGARLDAVEMDTGAAGQAMDNVAASPWKQRIHVIQQDIKAFEKENPRQYNVIISNPPFYENELSPGNSGKAIAHHDTGLLLHELLAIIKRLLEPHGKFYLLLPFKRWATASRLIQKAGLRVRQVMLVKQSTRHDHFRLFIAGQHAAEDDASYLEDEISIWNDRQQYTEEFTALLKDYYLHL